MSLKIKITAAIFAGMILLIALIAWSRYGEYDTRDLPSNIHITAKAMDGYYVHAKASFYPSVEIPALCVQIMGTPGSSTISTAFDNVTESGVNIKTKKRWKGLCGYQLNMIWITCTKTTNYHKFKNDSIGETGIGILEKNTTKIDPNKYGYHILSKNKIEGNNLKVIVVDGKNHFFGCDTGCEDNGDFGIDSATKSLHVTCEERTK